MSKRNQPRLPEIRQTTSACIAPDTMEDIQMLADEHECSVSWVVTFALESFLYGRAANPMPPRPRSRKSKTNHR